METKAKTIKLPPRDEWFERHVLGTVFRESQEAVPMAEEFGLEEPGFYPSYFLRRVGGENLATA